MIGIFMNNNINFLKRLKKIIPSHIQPKFKYEKELLTWNYQQGELFSKYIIQKNKKMKKKYILEKSGIGKLHINCSFKNYIIQHTGHKKALLLSKNYARKFNTINSNFIFLGKSGTGKSHLAIAIGNYLILKGKNIFIITISNLMLNIKKSFNNTNKNFTEEKIINHLSTVDLLILDEIGIQTESKYEKIIIHQIVTRRTSERKPIGILSNLNYQEIQKVLGTHIMNKIKLKNSLCLNFFWNSYKE